MADMRHHVVPEGFCYAVPCELSKQTATAKRFPELAQLLKLCLLTHLTVRPAMLFCSFLYRFLQSPDKRRDENRIEEKRVEELCRALPMCECRSHI